MMRKPSLFCFALLIAWIAQANAASPVVVVTDAAGAAGRVSAPVSLAMDRSALPGGGAATDGLQLMELTTDGTDASSPIPAQFIPATDEAAQGTLWWLMPPGKEGERRFQLTLAETPVANRVVAVYDKDRKAVDVTDGASPVLRYNHGTVPPPPEIVEKYEKQRDPPLFYGRGHYIHPLHGPDGESLSDDYSIPYVHHRGLSWAWPRVHYKGEPRDIWAVRVLPTQPGGGWARPVAMHRVLSGPVLSLVDAECVWKWSDTEPIVKDRVVIRAFRQTDRRRFLDVDIELVALVDEVELAGQRGATYGGFNLRSFPEFEGRRIDMHFDPAGADPRRAWFHLAGTFPGGKGPAGVALMEAVTNPDYPNWPKPGGIEHVPDVYPSWLSVQFGWPGDRRVALPKGEPLVLKYRLWIHPGPGDEATLTDAWTSFARPATASVVK